MHTIVAHTTVIITVFKSAISFFESETKAIVKFIFFYNAVLILFFFTFCNTCMFNMLNADFRVYLMKRVIWKIDFQEIFLFFFFYFTLKLAYLVRILAPNLTLFDNKFSVAVALVLTLWKQVNINIKHSWTFHINVCFLIKILKSTKSNL